MNRSKFLVLARLFEDLPNHVSRAVKRHNELLKAAYDREYITIGETPDYYKNFWEDGDIRGLDSSGVSIYWDIYARSCNVDSGTYDIPIDVLCLDTQDEALEKIISKKLEEVLKERERKRNYKEAQEREQFEKLKKKFES